MFSMPDGQSEQARKTNEKVKKMVQARSLVKKLVASIPDYQIRAWCRQKPEEMSFDITADWRSYKDTLSEPDKMLVIEMWDDVLTMTAREVATLVKNYGK